MYFIIKNYSFLGFSEFECRNNENNPNLEFKCIFFSSSVTQSKIEKP